MGALSDRHIRSFRLCNVSTADPGRSVCRQTVIVGLFFQQAIALFVLKSDAGFKIFKWIAFLAADFLEESRVGAIFLFDEDVVVTRHWFFAGVLAAIIFFIAFVQMMYYLGVMQWIIKHLCVGFPSSSFPRDSEN